MVGVSRRSLIAGAGIGLSLAGAGWAKVPARRKLWIDGLSFLPENLNDVAAAGLEAMIADVSRVETVSAADGTPRYVRTYASSIAAVDDAVARLRPGGPAWLALRGSDIGRHAGCATFLQFQSTEMIETDLSRLAAFHAKGLRILQFTHHNDTPFAGGAIEPHQTGLTPLGIEGLAEMNRLRLLPDVSHGSVPTMLEAAQRSITPIILSHGAARAIVDHPRAAPDEVIRAIAERGGMMGVFMMSFWLTRDPVPTPAHYVAQLRHVINVGGIGSVGISNDFPIAGEATLVKLGNDNRRGVQTYMEWWHAMRKRGVPGFSWDPQHVVIPEFNRIDRMARIAATLEQARFKAVEIDHIMGGNWRRVLIDVLG